MGGVGELELSREPTPNPALSARQLAARQVALIA